MKRNKVITIKFSGEEINSLKELSDYLAIPLTTFARSILLQHVRDTLENGDGTDTFH